MSVKMRMPKLTESLSAPLQTDTKPYLMKPVPVGNRERLKLIGGTVAVNQQMIYGDFSADTWWNSSNATRTVANNILTTTLAGVSSATQISHTEGVAPTTIGHKYLVWCSINPPKATECRFQYSSIATGNPVMDAPANTWTKLHSIFACTGQNGVLFYYNTSTQLAVDDQVQFKNFCCFDLTQMFGTAIADYAYTLETGEAGAGIAWLKSFGFFAKDYYPYDAGSLLSVKTSGHVSGGHSYPLSDIELRGIPKLVSGAIVYDGDSYEADGTVTRRYGVVTFDGSSDESWGLQSINSNNIANFQTTFPHYPAANRSICNLFDPQTSSIASTTTEGYFLHQNGTDLYIRIASSKASTTSAFRTYLASHPVTIIYELATPTTETADAYESPQIVETGGTESFIDGRTVEMPVGNVSEYCDAVKSVSIGMRMGKGLSVKMRMGGEL